MPSLLSNRPRFRPRSPPPKQPEQKSRAPKAAQHLPSSPSGPKSEEQHHGCPATAWSSLAPHRSFHGSREARNAHPSTPPSVVKQHGSLCEGACAPDGILRGPRGGVHGGDPGGVRVGEARGGSSGQCGQACSTHLEGGGAGEEAQEHRATSTQVGEEEGEIAKAGLSARNHRSICLIWLSLCRCP